MTCYLCRCRPARVNSTVCGKCAARFKNTESLLEPLTDSAVVEADTEIANRKREVRRSFDEHRLFRTPRDESPESERRKRLELCGVIIEDDE
jgi:hypothetical protein